MSSLFSDKKKDLCKKIRKYKSDSSIRSEKDLSKNIRKFKSDSCLAGESNSFSKRLSLALEEIESFEQDFVAKIITR